MEEWVGLKWHDYVTRQAMGEFPEYAVHLKDEARTLGVLFRALGGDPALSLVTAEPRQFQIRRKFLQKLAGTHRKFELAWRDDEFTFAGPTGAVPFEKTEQRPLSLAGCFGFVGRGQQLQLAERQSGNGAGITCPLARP